MLTNIVRSAAILALATTSALAEPRVLFDFEGDFPLDERTESHGGKASLVQADANTALRIDVGADQSWPGVRLLPPEGKWDLSTFERVELEITNVGDAKARVLCRVDNPGADGRRHCNTDGGRLEPGQTKTFTVVFGKSWGGAGFHIDTTNIVGLLIFVDRPKQAHALTVDNVRAAGEVVVLPDWIGTRPPVPGDWEQTLDENFDGDDLNLDLWNTRLVWDGPLKSALHAYSARNIIVADGALKIKVEKRHTHQFDEPDLPTREYASAILTTFDKWTQKHGYFEARVKLTRARGTWPAFWMMPDRGPEGGDVWQRRSTHNGGMEIDVMEHLAEWGPGRYNVAAHWDGYDKQHQRWGDSRLTYSRTADDFHVFGMLWEEGKLTFFCDGEEKANWENERVCSVPVYLKLCVQMGGWATKNVDDAALPDYMVVDWVRAWRRAASTNGQGPG